MQFSFVYFCSVLTCESKYNFLLQFDYDYKAGVILPVYGKIKGGVHNVSISIEIQIDLNKYQVILHKLKIHDVG